MSANFEIVETFDGYYVKVTGKVDLNLLSQELRRHRLDVDVSKIMREIVNAKVGQEILILTKPEEPEGKIILTIAPGKMTALLTLNIKPGEKVPLDVVFQKLKEKQIVHGVNLERIKTLINLKRPAYREVIAAGDPPERGLDASISYTYQQPTLDPSPVEDGFAYEPGRIITVRQGEVLAQRTPSTLGIFGCNVLGEIVHPLPGRNLEFNVGNNVTVQGNTALAAKDGALTWENSVMEVADVNTVPEDLRMGVISAKGMVLVLGSVGPGAHVQAQGDVEIQGSIEGGSVTSVNGSIFVKGGIIGGGRSVIKAAGNVEAQFIEESTVEAGKNLIINRYVFNSSISVGKAVYFKTVKEYTLPDIVQVSSKPASTQSENTKPFTSQFSYPERVKQISKDTKAIERDMKSFTARFKTLADNEDSGPDLREQLETYFNQAENLDNLKQERQNLVNQYGGKGLGILGLLINVGVGFRLRYEQLVLEQSVSNVTMFYDYHKRQVACSGQ
ncbi:MAG: DUF342 domain-containing protein [Syntrophomonadales bacterium]